MPQTYIEDLALQIAKDLGDPRTDYTLDGKTITAAMLESGINQAVSELYEAKLGDGELTTALAEKFANKYTDYRSIVTLSRLVPNGSTKEWDKPAETTTKIKKIISIEINATNPLITGKIAYPYTDSQYQAVINNIYSNHKPSADKPRFFEYKANLSLELGGTTAITLGTLKLLCLLEPVYQAFGTTLADILAPRQWRTEIIEFAKQLILGDHQT